MDHRSLFIVMPVGLGKTDTSVKSELVRRTLYMDTFSSSSRLHHRFLSHLFNIYIFIVCDMLRQSILIRILHPYSSEAEKCLSDVICFFFAPSQ